MTLPPGTTRACSATLVAGALVRPYKPIEPAGATATTKLIFFSISPDKIRLSVFNDVVSDVTVRITAAKERVYELLGEQHEQWIRE